LAKLQAGVQKSESQGAAWLSSLGLDNVARLWQQIRVETGWDTAVEAALGEAMAALAVEAQEHWSESPPEARFELLLPVLTALPSDVLAPTPAIEITPASEGDLNPLADLIHTDNPLIARFLADRLALAYATDTLQHALQLRALLPPGGFIATRDGHRVSRDSLIFNAPEKAHQGLLARAREIERLQEAGELAQASVEEIAEEVVQAETAQQNARRQGEALQSQLSRAQAQIHQLQVSLVRVQEAARRVADRRAQIAVELDEIYDQLGIEEATWNDASERNREALLEIDFARERFDEVREVRREADLKLQTLRELHRRVEREAQEAAFQARSLATRLQDLAGRGARAEAVLADLVRDQLRLQGELDAAQETSALTALDAALAQRQQAEVALTAVREALEGANAALRELDTARLTCERALEPLKERALGFELKLQEAQLNEARYSEELEAVDQPELETRAQAAGLAGRAESWLKNELNRLESEISALGPVNMAALDELKAAQERKQYLDDQSLDLETAAATLEEAIRRIDAETRTRLKDTYDRVSREFKTLFTELFGGGEAQLILTGEEILDAGLTVLAQPPGKKNSSIHLLSGGEKALTALSLVFAFFRLNPAPFCLLDEVDAPLDDSNTERYCALVSKMSAETQFLFITHNRITMEMAHNLVGVTMPEPGVSRPVAVDVEDAVRMAV
jgi:chromosome segregation protein